MFDNLRQQSMEESGALNEPADGTSTAAMQQQALGFIGAFTPPQRFILALMIFLNVSVLGCASLIIFEKIALF